MFFCNNNKIIFLLIILHQRSRSDMVNRHLLYQDASTETNTSIPAHRWEEDQSLSQRNQKNV